MWSITHIIFYFLLFHAQTAMNSDWHDVGWGTSTDAMSTEAPQQTSSHKFRLTLRWLGHLDWRDVNQGTSTHIHVERYRWLRAIHHSKNTASVYICSCVSLCEKILTWLLLFIPVKYSHEISCLQPKTKGKGNNMVVQKSRDRIQLATRKACQQNICSKTAIAKCGSTQG